VSRGLFSVDLERGRVELRVMSLGAGRLGLTLAATEGDPLTAGMSSECARLVGFALLGAAEHIERVTAGRVKP